MSVLRKYVCAIAKRTKKNEFKSKKMCMDAFLN